MTLSLSAEHLWIGIGFLGQAVFGARFLIQWFQSERHRKSVIPIAFWYCSLAGSVLLLAYAIYRKDPVFILGQSLGFIIYIRNLHLIHQEKQKSLSGQDSPEAGIGEADIEGPG